MDIYIHTAGRVAEQPTYTALYDAGLRPILVVQSRERIAYANAWPSAPMIVLPSSITTLSPTRQWLLEQAKGKFVLMDDDLRFFVRRTDDPTKFLPATKTNLKNMLTAVEKALAQYAHVGICAREGGNRMTADAECTRMMRVLAYNKKMMPKTARFDRLPTKQDFDMTLQLLRAGLPNLVLHRYVHDQFGSNTAGGCSEYRTDDMMVASAHGLKKLHPEFVTVVEKETKVAWGGGTRTDVRIAWKKAYESA
jgi:hypothetical protein